MSESVHTLTEFSRAASLHALWLRVDTGHRTRERVLDADLLGELDTVMVQYFESMTNKDANSAFANSRSTKTSTNYISKVVEVLAQRGWPPPESQELARREYISARAAVHAVRALAPD
jgi:hypothetical protein